MSKEYIKIQGVKIAGETYLSASTIDRILLSDLDARRDSKEISNYIRMLRERIAEACDV